MKKKLLFLLLLMFSCYEVKAETLEERMNNLDELLDVKISNDLLESDDIYPVGSIYMSTSSTNPGTLFGGTWESYAADRKLVGVGSNGTTTYSAGGTGGASTKTISTSNIPSHNHSLTATGTVTSTFKGSQVTTSSSGGHTHATYVKLCGWEAAGYGLRQTSNHGGAVMVWYGDVAQYSRTTTSTTYNSTHTVTPAGTVSSTFTGTSATSSSVGSGSSFSVQNPYVVVYMWKRTA